MKKSIDRSVGYMLGPIRRHYLFSRKMVILEWSLHPDLEHISNSEPGDRMGTRECSREKRSICRNVGTNSSTLCIQSKDGD